MTSSDSRARRALVVEDEPAIGDLCRRLLAGEGFEVDVAINGKVAQDLIGKRYYDLCLIDIRTPEMTGPELYEWLKAKHPQMASRVIFTSGDVMRGDTGAFLERAGRPFLPKPFRPDELKAIVAEASKGAP